MSKQSLDNIADKGSQEFFKLDKVSSTALSRIQAIFSMNSRMLIRKDYLVRVAIRHYLQHLKSRSTKFYDEVEMLTKAVEGGI